MSETAEKRKRRISQSNKDAFRNPWVLGWIAGIAFVLLVNVGFIITAVFTNPGLVDKNYYERGRNFEQEFVTMQKARNRLGWQMKLDAVHAPHVNQPVRYTFTVVDRAGVPVEGDRALLKAYRPSDASADFEQKMERVAPGVYSAELSFPLKGIWDLTAILHRNEDALHITQRISVQSP